MTNLEHTTDNKATTTTDHRGSSTGGTSSPGARARTREAAMLHGQYVDCCNYYVQCFRRAVVPVIQRELATRIKDGMTADVIRAAMDETQAAPRPSWAYCLAILRRCDLEGIKTLSDWQRSKERFTSSRNPALNYEQRDYTEDMFGMDFFVDPAEYCRERGLDV